MSVRVGIGLSRLPFHEPDAFWRWVEACETSALDSLWQTDRLVSTEPFLESMAAMSAIAATTRRIKFGMNAVVVACRDPLLLAKQCATIDFLSGGRLLPVFGVGAEDAPEWRFSSSGDPRARGARANEALELMQRLWTEEHVDFEGRYFRCRDVTLSPRPLQKPLPCWIGGSSRAAVRRTARLGTGWLGGAQGPEEVAHTISAIRAELERTGRQIDPDHYGASLAFRIGALDRSMERALESRARRTGRTIRDLVTTGDARDVIERLRTLHASGASKYVLLPLVRDAKDALEQTRRLASEVVPEVHAWPDPTPPSSATAPPPNP